METNFENEKEILNQELQGYKNMLDNAYDTTKNKHSEEQALTAMTMYFLIGKIDHFTRDNNARANMRTFSYLPNNVLQILLNYAISSSSLKDEKIDISQDEIYAYANDSDYKLDYDKEKVITIVASATTLNPYWTANLMVLNKRIKQVLISSFVEERYLENKRKELDSVKSPKVIRVNGKPLIMSVDTLNKHIQNMNRDDGYLDENNHHMSK